MEGIFFRRKFNVWLFLLFVCGLTFIGMYVFFNVVDRDVTGELLIFLIVGVIICVSIIPSWLLDFGAFIRIDENSIKAKYHWFGRIDCKLSDVTFAATRANTLIVQLNNGKIHTITGVANSCQLASLIRKKMSCEVTEAPGILIERLNGLRSAGKRELLYVILGVALMFVNIFITVFLTGGRDMHEFTRTDRIMFFLMGAVELVTTIATFYFAGRAGRYSIPMEKLQYEIQRSIVETEQLPSGNIIRVFSDESYSVRVTLFGYPNEDSVYYTVQGITSDYNLIETHVSEIYEDIEQLPDGFESLIDITEKVLTNY